MLNKYIAKQIVLAQICSDAGKNIHELKLKEKNVLYRNIDAGYAGKEDAIKRAITKINSLGSVKSGFHFYVTNNSGNRYYPYLIYFNFEIHGERKQVSFHSANKEFERYVKKGTSHRITWDHKSSRGSCKALINMFDF